jgi:hypothetical protein
MIGDHMKRLSQLLAATGFASALLLSASNLIAQNDPPPPADGGQGRQGGRGGRGGSGGGFDPAQMQQRMMENIREQMAVKDDAEWKILEERIQKVADAQREIGFGGGMRRMFRRPGGDTQNNDQGGNRRRGMFGGEPSAEEQALDKAIDSKASKEEIKNAMTKYRASKKDKEAKLVAAQDELKKVLSVQQEAVALAMGLVK